MRTSSGAIASIIEVSISSAWISLCQRLLVGLVEHLVEPGIDVEEHLDAELVVDQLADACLIGCGLEPWPEMR